MTEELPDRSRTVWLLVAIAVVAALVVVGVAGYLTAETAAERFVIGLARLDGRAVGDTLRPEDQVQLLDLHHTVFGVSRSILVQGVAVSGASFQDGHLSFAVRLALVPLDPDFQDRVVDVGVSPAPDGWRVVSYSSARVSR